MTRTGILYMRLLNEGNFLAICRGVEQGTTKDRINGGDATPAIFSQEAPALEVPVRTWDGQGPGSCPS